MDQQEIAERLWQVAMARAAGHGVRFGDGAAGDVQAMTRHAAAEITKGTVPEAQAMRTAEMMIERLVDEMKRAAVEIRGNNESYPSDIIGEQTFARARSLLCPSWPLCP